MKRQIRFGVFETNSSSMHSLVIKKDGHNITNEEFKLQAYIGEDGVISVRSHDLEFGRHPFRFLSDVKDKAFYVLASKCKFKNDETYKEVIEAIKSICPEFNDFDLDFEAETYSKKYYSEAEIKNNHGEGNYAETENDWIVWGYNTGYVDEDILSAFLKQENISIKDFITNTKYVVVVDGDEYCIYKDMKKSGIINKDNIEKEFCPNAFSED